jgi:hypothetical protein
VACARCHDHKFDPITQGDYYSLAGIFASTETYFGAPASSFGSGGSLQNRQPSNLIELPIKDPNPFDVSYRTDELEKMRQEVTETRQELTQARRSAASGRPDGLNSQTAIANLARSQGKLEMLSDLLGSVDAKGNPRSFCMGVQDSTNPRDSRVLVRGEIDQPGPAVVRGVPRVLTDSNLAIKPDSSGRLELARWITRDDHPLTARVMVNRIWQHTMGAGIVRTTEDFGSTGQYPTHPELLDYLANRFVANKWSVKSMIKEIVMSRTYRMSTEFDNAKFEQDPENKLLWRAFPKRLDAEAFRDAMLTVSGEISLQRPRASEVAKAGFMQVRDGSLVNFQQILAMSPDGNPREMIARTMMGGSGDNRPPGFGPGMRERMDRMRRMGPGNLPGMNAGVGADRVDMVDATYRSVYLPILRDQLPRSLEVFDFAEPSMVVGTRDNSSTPNQALFLMNNPLVLKASQAFANRVVSQTSEPRKAIEQAFLLALGRRPTAFELKAVNMYSQSESKVPMSPAKQREILVGLCQSLFASSEFRYLD